MLLQISYDAHNLADALAIAKQTHAHADILEVGTTLLYQEGIHAIKAFRETFPQKTLFADANICDNVQESTALFSSAGTDIMTVLAGATNQTIQRASEAAHNNSARIALDLIDAYSMAQSAMDAKILGADFIVFHKSNVSPLEDILDQWETVRGNTDVPILLSGRINRNNMQRVLSLKPHGIVVGKAITEHDEPSSEAAYFKSLVEQQSKS